MRWILLAPERANFSGKTPLNGAQSLVPPPEQTLGCASGFYKCVRYPAYPSAAVYADKFVGQV
ncbi:MAG: hypothetical protein LBI06_08265 [Treponema sp.]|nr:hypothetical protein [Treponema sp.]